MDRRSFLLWAGAGTAAVGVGSAAAYWRWQEIVPAIHAPGRAEGHFLRDRRALPPPSAEIRTDIAILGSGVAGLTAAWKLRKEGQRDIVVVDGPQPYGNAAAGRYGDLAYPTGAHYLPLPAPEMFHVRELLHDLRILLRNPTARRPYYDERFILHAPEERLLFNGRWQEGLLPREGVPQWELDEQARFFAAMDGFKSTSGADGKPMFAFPVTQSSADAHWQELDRISLKTWLEQHGYRSPTLHWYLDYCCRDDYGTAYGEVSAWAGLHYFCGRGGESENASEGAFLTWPGGLDPIAAGLDRAAGNRRMTGTVVSVDVKPGGVEALCLDMSGAQPRSYVVRARKAICAMPLFVAARVLRSIGEYGFDARQHMPAYAPWMVANFLMKRFPDELPEAPLSWDNVVYGGRGLGYVVSTHQDIRVTPPRKTVFSAYVALADRSPQDARRWLDSAPPEELLDLAGADLRAAYGRHFAANVQRADISLRAHAMASPRIGFRDNPGVRALREADGPILFAHADLSGFSVFEEAAWWGYQAAMKALK